MRRIVPARHGFGRALSLLAVFGWSLFAIAPVVAITWIALSSPRDVLRGDFSGPDRLTLGNVRQALRGATFGHPIWHAAINSLTAVSVGLAIGIALGAPVAFVLGTRQTRLTRLASRYFWALIAVPGIVTWIPLFVFADRFHLLSSPWALGIIYSGGTLAVVVALLQRTFAGLPREVLDAARVDGASEWRTFTSVALPMARRPLVAVALLQVVFLWQELGLASILLQRGSSRTIPVEIALFRGQYSSNIGAQRAAVALSLIPLLCLYVIARRRFLEDLRWTHNGASGP